MPTLRKILGLGTWKGHPKGPFAITPELINAAYDYFTARKVKIPANYEHDRSQTAGWIASVTKKPDGLYGEVEYTSKATDDIKDEQYPYVSPELLFDTPDEITGENIPLQVVGLAITKMPFMQDLGETVLNSKAVVLCSFDIDGNEITNQQIEGNSMDPKEILAKMIVAAGLPPETPPEQLEAFIKKLREFLSMVPAEGGAPATPDEAAAVMPEMVANHKAIIELAKQVKCKPAELKTKIEELMTKPDANPETVELSKKLEDQSTQIVNLQKEAKQSRLELFLSKNANKITPAMKKDVETQFMENEPFITKFYDGLPGVISAPVVLSKRTPENAEPEEKAMAEALGLSLEDYLHGSGPDGQKYFANKKNGGT